MPTAEQERQQITMVIEQYRQGFLTLDAERLMAIWDHEYDQIIYIAQEMAEPISGWEGVAHYYHQVVRLLEHVTTMEVRDVSIAILGEVACVFLKFHFEGQINGRAHIADGWVTFLLHRRCGNWKVIHYHESRPGDRLSQASSS
jgi:ketosteroid isomerase-like protein